MPTQDDIDHQRQILDAHRATLAHYLVQRARLGADYAPPGVTNGIREARAEIRRVKSVLRGWGVAVEELPDDAEEALAPLGQSPPADRAIRGLWPWVRSLTTRERRLWQSWALAGAIGWGLVGMVQIVGWLGAWGAPVTWGLAALAQWGVLRQLGFRRPWWPLTGVIGGAVATALRQSAGGVGGWFVGTVVGWGVASLMQWALLRPHSTRAPWWAPISLAIGILSWQISRTALQIVFSGLIAAGMTVSYLVSNAVAVTTYWAIAGALYGAIAGPVLVWLLRSPRMPGVTPAAAARGESGAG